jgi:hypothetical protein
MTEAQDSSAGNTGKAANAECLCGTVRKVIEEIADAFTPSENVQQHFREARVQMLMGLREIINNRIDHLNRTGAKGTRVVVE